MITNDAARALEAFMKSVQTNVDPELASWLFTDRQIGGGRLADMEFYSFLGPEHLARFFDYIRNFPFPDYFDEDAVAALRDASIENDRRAFERLGLTPEEKALRTIGTYNAQDFLAQRAYPVPDRQRPRRVLDFGAGHGRNANLALSSPQSVVKTYVAVDGIPASYLTQTMYYGALGHRVHDHLDHPDEPLDLDAREDEFDVFHLPTWRMHELPSGWFDMVWCVQVLRELSREVLVRVLPELVRVLKPGGALYVRDHLTFHNPSGMPQDELLAALGMISEWYPRVRDKSDIHGVPRIWRKFDADIYRL